jgi:phosphatidylglycerophosphate synthase
MLKMRELEEIPDLIIYRPLAFLLVKAVSRTTIRPDQISFAAILMGIISGYFYSIGKETSFVTAAAFYLFFNILDCSDGMLARLKKSGSMAGRIIDGISDYIATIAVYTGLAIGYAAKSQNPPLWLILLIFTAISSGVHSIMVDYYRNRFMDFIKGGKSNFSSDIIKFRREYVFLRKQKKGKINRLILWLYLRYTLVQSSLITKKEESKLIAGPEDYYEKNKKIMRFWVLLGPSMEITLLLLFSFLNRIDIFIMLILILFNFLALVLWIKQSIIDKSFKSLPE